MPSVPDPARFRAGPVAFRSLAFLLAAGPAAAQDDPATLVLDPISISANLVPTPSSAIGSAVTIITGEELERRQVRTIAEALRSVPGISVAREGPFGQRTQVRMRGSEANQTLVLIDGIRANDPSADSEFDFAHLLADDIERIEVLRGPQSALYGSDAIGGVISIVTRRGEGRAKVRARAEGGSFGTGLGHVSVSGGDAGYDFIAGLTGVHTDGISVADEAAGNTERDGYRNGTGFAKVTLRPSDMFDLSLVGRYVNARADTDGFLTEAIDAPGEANSEQLFGRAEGRVKLLDGRWEHVFGAGYTRYDRDFRDEFGTSTFLGETGRLNYRSSLSFDTAAIAHTATFAASTQQEDVVSEGFGTFDRSIGSTGLVGQYQALIAEDLALTASLRHDVNELFDDATTGRLTGAYTIAATGTKLRASYGTGVKNPTLFELYGSLPTYQGNPDLRPEHARGFDVGVDQSFWGGRAALELTYFDQRIEDLITGAGATSVNLPGESVVRGVEFGLSAALTEALSLRAAYTLSDGEDADGLELIRRPRHGASLDLNYAFLAGRANVNLGLAYTGERQDLAFDAAFNPMRVTLGDYLLVNLAASYRLNDNSELYARLENLLDEDYQEVFSYGTTGRAAYAGLRMSF